MKYGSFTGSKRAYLSFVLVAGLSIMRTAQADYSFNFTPNTPDPINDYVNLYGINNNGDLVGSYSSDGNNFYGFVNTSDFTGPAPSGMNAYNTELYGINNNGQVVGSYSVNGNDVNAFYASSTNYNTAVLTPLADSNTNGGSSVGITYVTGLNDTGEVVGYHNVTGATLQQYGYIYNTNTASYSDIAPASVTSGRIEPAGINNSGTVVGSYVSTDGTHADGFVYTAAGNWSLIDDPNANSTGTFITGINNNGLVVGYYYDNSGNNYEHGFVYDLNTNSFVNAQVDAPLWTNADSLQINGINDQGVIVGAVSSQTGDTVYQEFTAMPVPEPSQLALLSTGLACIDWLKRRRASC